MIDFLPDVFPGHKNLVVAIAGSWHRFTSVFGKILVELAAKGSTTRDISRFRITRSGLLTQCPELPPVNSSEQKTIRDPSSGCRTEYSESESNKVNASTTLTMRRTSADPGNWHVTARIQGDAFHKTFLWWSAASHEFWIQGKVFRDGEQPTAMRSAGTPVWKDEVGGRAGWCPACMPCTSRCSPRSGSGEGGPRRPLRSPARVDWIDDLKATSYGEGGYPWTRLGYTYDWNPDGREVGLSEFVIRKGRARRRGVDHAAGRVLPSGAMTRLERGGRGRELAMRG